MRHMKGLLVLILVLTGCQSAQDRSAADHSTIDSVFAAVQARGRTVMGVDQYTSSHVFEDFPTGGRVVLDRDDPADTAAINVIRRHMREVAADFEGGNFTRPFQVHAQTVPGTEVMRERSSTLSYSVVDRPRGAEVRITTTDSVTLAAVHAFLAFQRADHRAPGTENHSGH